jgi:ubiquinone/menaquinone biosynthesis C-methylase UbiE
MTIYKSNTLIETYKIKAKCKDINELTGRTGRPDLTQFIIANVLDELDLKKNTILVDIGCGDGTLLARSVTKGIDSYLGRVIGILPTHDEVMRVRHHLLTKSEISHHLISIEAGTAEKTNLPDGFCDILVCNGVLHGAGQKRDDVIEALKEFRRIVKDNGYIFIGEMPDRNELENKEYGDSILKWLIWVLKKEGLGSLFKRLRQLIPAFFSNEPFIISPKVMFFMAPNEFIALLEEYGFEVIKHYKNKEINEIGLISESATRWNYFARKKKASH